MSNAQHTPFTVEQASNSLWDVRDAAGVLIGCYPTHEQAAFIVTACNSHGTLVEALRDIAGESDLDHANHCRWCGRIYTERYRARGLCPSDDCAGFKARALLASLEVEG